MAQGDARIGFFWVAGINRRPQLYWTSLGAIPTSGLAQPLLLQCTNPDMTARDKDDKIAF
jgi:hypothetical protein